MMSFAEWWQALVVPLMRLLLGIGCGLLVASLIEALGLARFLSRLASPLVRAAHMGPTAGAAFALAFASPGAANALLAEALEEGTITRRELILSNLFNSLPAYLVHLPTLVLTILPVLGTPALTYAGLTLTAAALRTGATLCVARMLLPKQTVSPENPSQEKTTLRDRLGHAWPIAWKRFRRRIPRVFLFTIPIYTGVLWLHYAGIFAGLEEWLAKQSIWGAWFNPQAAGIIALSLLAEVGASISAAGALLHTGSLRIPDIVLALLIGNILSTPMRAIRHQLPSYAGYYRPALAVRLVCANQTLRAASMCLVAVAYFVWTR